MASKLRALVLGVLALTVAAVASAQEAQPPRERLYAAPAPLTLSGATVATFDAPDADQGVAVDRKHFYAIDNTVIAKHARTDGASVARWAGPRGGLVRHLNSCAVSRGKIWCANSNYSQTPHGSSVEIFNPRTMRHFRSISLGLTEEGSLTWTTPIRGGHLAGFAHYDGNGGVAHKSHVFSSVVTFDAAWRRTGGYLFPATVLERMKPHAASGGALGPDGLLYVLGHDRPELYVLARPVMGPTLLHIATIAIEAEGQAFSFAPDGAREIWAIDRRRGRVLVIALPPAPLDGFADARPFAR